MKRDLVDSEEATPAKKVSTDTDAEQPLSTVSTGESLGAQQVASQTSTEDGPKDEGTAAIPTPHETVSENPTGKDIEKSGTSDTLKASHEDSSDVPSPKLKSGNPLLSGAFGKSSAFGSSFGKSAFGSSFGSAFGSFGGTAITPKENPWTESKPKSPEEGGSEKPTATETKSTDQYAVVSLEKQDVKTGEEEEITVFQARSKLYAMNLKDTASGWKERGVGTLHLNFSESQNKHRVLMRADALHKVILNVPLGPHTDIHKGFQSSAQSAKFVRLSGAESDGALYQYAMRLQTVELADELFEQLQAAKN